MTTITSLEDARALKRLGVPLNTPIEHREFSPAYTDHWVDLMVAQAKFVEAIKKIFREGAACPVGAPQAKVRRSR
jgi:hypothetical protein